MDELNLRTRIVRQDGEALPGRLGLLLSDESSDEVVALTAGQVARGAGAIFAHGSRIGVCSYDVDRRFDDEGKRPAWTMLEIVRLDKTVLLAHPSANLLDHGPAGGLRLTADVAKHLGEVVLVHSGTLAARHGILRSLNAPFRMPAPNNEASTLFTGALMITSLDGKPLSQEGDAGALVASIDGDCLGIVVAGLDDSSYAAPIAPILTDDAFRTIDDAFVHDWNLRAQLRRLASAPQPLFPLPAPPSAEPVIDMRNDDWIEDPKAMAEASLALAEDAL